MIARRFFAPLLIAPASAFAAVPASVTTALTDGAADAATMAGLLLTVAVGVVLIFLGIKYVKKLPRVG